MMIPNLLFFSKSKNARVEKIVKSMEDKKKNILSEQKLVSSLYEKCGHENTQLVA